MYNTRIQSSKERKLLLKKQVASNLRDHQENTSNLLTQGVERESKEITDLESLDHAYVVALNKIDEDRNANIIKSIFKPWPPI
jgi:formyltetrahydrofolate synthetase